MNVLSNHDISIGLIELATKPLNYCLFLQVQTKAKSTNELNKNKNTRSNTSSNNVLQTSQKTWRFQKY